MMIFEFDTSNIIGKGAFAKVFFGYLYEGAGQSACKRARTGETTQQSVCNKESSGNSRREIAVKRIEVDNLNTQDREGNALRSLNHPNVVKLLHAESDDTFR